MNNKYGYFSYQDYANGAKEDANLSTPNQLQEGADLNFLKNNIRMPEYQTLEQNEYVTRNPKIFRLPEYSVGFVTSDISDENGCFQNPIVVKIQFPEYFSMTGLTILTRNVVKKAKIEGYRDGDLVASSYFSANNKNYFYPIELEIVNSIKFIVFEIEEPYHFFGVYSIKYGRTKNFFDEDVVSASITNNFSVLGDSLSYDILDLTVKNPSDIGSYMFQKKQSIEYINNGIVSNRLFVDSGSKNQNGTASITAYDGISNLEDTFLGGIYNNVSVYDVIQDICGGRVYFKIEADRSITISGYIPVCTRRKALQMVLMAANLRCYKGEIFTFAPLETEERPKLYDEKNIVGEPKINDNEPIRSVQINYHNYSKSKEEAEVYHWYIAQNENVQITFSGPVHTFSAYEVIGTDENGQDIVSSSISKNVQFVDFGANYCTVFNTSPNKIVIKAKKYSDSISTHKMTNKYVLRDEVYNDIIVDMTLHGDVEKTCETMYNQYMKKNYVNFKTLDDPCVGGLYKILGNTYYISKKKMSLDGIYEVEAV